ncbi:hypothetical protein IWQ47_003805 [Aquimarina sp. EL_43]|uniref:hypothetical protein n=1 Tax=Aquimarina TaxID=290174 RepID=UPI00046EA081|nr:MULTISPECIES: hypothetical protein [Aquimarina]MBG6132580.1 hypothetical protein [Aquimarina sp. EL_35]MBG6152711.1 hypothetical protein [Aquimarina sp. EL_32]MBG6170718.1 hypothetical protein [Aquimarina sp. EL_43]
MKSKKKLSLKKMNVAQLDSIKGGINWPHPITGPGLPTADPFGCGNGTQGLACQYSQTPMSCQVCVNAHK